MTPDELRLAMGLDPMAGEVYTHTFTPDRTVICDGFNVPPHMVGIGPRHRWTWRLRRWWRIRARHRANGGERFVVPHRRYRRRVRSMLKAEGP